MKIVVSQRFPEIFFRGLDVGFHWLKEPATQTVFSDPEPKYWNRADVDGWMARVKTPSRSGPVGGVTLRDKFSMPLPFEDTRIRRSLSSESRVASMDGFGWGRSNWIFPFGPASIHRARSNSVVEAVPRICAGIQPI